MFQILRRQIALLISIAAVSLSACSTTPKLAGPEKAKGSDQHFSHTLSTTASPSKIFSLWTNPTTWQDWDKGLKSARIEGAFLQGATGAIVPLSGPEAEFTVIEVVENQKVVFETSLPLATLVVSRYITAEQGGEMTITHDIKFNGAMSWLWGGILGSDFRSQLIPTMKNLITIAEDGKMYLNETSYLNYNHPTIKKAIADATESAATEREKAIAIHDYVRDNIVFGFSSAFYDMPASEVLAAGRGFCNNQSTLFAAMLRGAGVPARHRFYSLSANVLEGIINPGTSYVDHAVVEVYIEGKWIALDSYIVDTKHSEAVQPGLIEGMKLGMRANASLEWDGSNSSFSQFHPDYVEKEFGVFEDVGEFYEKVDTANNRFGFLEKVMFPFAIGNANKKVASIRGVGN